MERNIKELSPFSLIIELSPISYLSLTIEMFVFFKEMLLRLQMQQQQQLKQQQQGETTSQDIAISQANEMTSVTDPFLGQTNTSDHTRQESTDSGVGM